VPARGEVTTISVSRRVAERLRRLRAKLGARSWDELFEKLFELLERGEGCGYEDALEALSALYQRARERAARGDPSGLAEFIVFVERKLSPLLSRWYEEAKALLQARGEDK
jgi:hypothetical protein